MNGKWWIKVILAMMFFSVLIISASNLSTRRLAEITSKEISTPFRMEILGSSQIQVGLLEKNIKISASPVVEKYTGVKASIQNSLVTVKCNLAPRIRFISLLWDKGIEKFREDYKW